MSIKLIEDKDKLPSRYSIAQSLLSEYKRSNLYWGKVYTTDSETFLGMQLPVTCKDYIVDTQYRSNSNIRIDIWEKEQLRENAFYIVFIDNAQKELFLANVPLLIHPIEKKQRIIRTKIFEPDESPFKNKNLPHVVVKGSQKWIRNSMAWSFYLSLIRLCAYTTKEIGFDLSNDYLRVTSDWIYYTSLQPKGKEIWNWLIKDCSVLFTKPPEEYDPITNYKNSFGPISHGHTGIFHCLTICDRKNLANMYTGNDKIYFTKAYQDEENNLRKNNYMFAEISKQWEELNGGKM